MNPLDRQLLDAIQMAVGSSSAFCVLAPSDARPATAAGSLVVDGIERPLSKAQIATLGSEWLDDGVRTWRSDFVAGHALWLVASLAVDGVRVSVGVARRGDSEVFDEPDLWRLEAALPATAKLVSLHAQCVEHRRRERVLRALRSVTDACCVVNLDARRVVWTYDCLDGKPCARDVLSNEPRFVALVEHMHLADPDRKDRGDATVGLTAATRLADLDSGWDAPGRDDDDRYLAVALVRVDSGHARLSNRERRIAQLLAGGYSVVNAAAILALSESTIRTYVRRIYQKLEITNRADLTRKAGELCLY